MDIPRLFGRVFYHRGATWRSPRGFGLSDRENWTVRVRAGRSAIRLSYNGRGCESLFVTDVLDTHIRLSPRTVRIADCLGLYIGSDHEVALLVLNKREGACGWFSQRDDSYY